MGGDGRRERRWWLLAVALGLLVMPACSRAVPGTPSAVPGTSSAVPGGIAPSTPRARAPALVSDVLADECLLDSAEFRALLGRADSVLARGE